MKTGMEPDRIDVAFKLCSSEDQSKDGFEAFCHLSERADSLLVPGQRHQLLLYHLIVRFIPPGTMAIADVWALAQFLFVETGMKFYVYYHPEEPAARKLLMPMNRWIFPDTTRALLDHALQSGNIKHSGGMPIA